MTTEDQLDVLRVWWSAKGKVIVPSVTAVLLVVGGAFTAWDWNRTEAAERASVAYLDIVNTFSTDPSDVDESRRKAQALIDDNPPAGYHVLALLFVARGEIGDGDLEAAETTLRRAVGIASGPFGPESLAEIARVRLARVLLGQGRAEDALTELDAVTPTWTVRQVAEARGDALMAAERYQAAAEQYQIALAEGTQAAFIEMKLARVQESALAQSGG